MPNKPASPTPNCGVRFARRRSLARAAVDVGLSKDVIQARSRKIPRDIARRLGVLLRHRCCLCKRLIDPHNYQRSDLSDYLEKHHIVLFSSGGEHTADNLLLLCPSCHSMVHSRPVDFPIETLRSRKAEWIALATIIPSDDSFELLEGTSAAILAVEAGQKIPAIFSVESLNLAYTIWAPCDTQYTILELSEVAFSRILKPLAKATNNQSWLFADAMDLAYRSSPSDALPRGGAIRHYVRVNDPFIGLVRTWAVPAAGRPFDLQRFSIELKRALQGVYAKDNDDGESRVSLLESAVFAAASEASLGGNIPPHVERSLLEATYFAMQHPKLRRKYLHHPESVSPHIFHAVKHALGE